MNTKLLAPCNYYCGNCIIHQKHKCTGCQKQNKKAQTQNKTFCDIYTCANNKKLTTCSNCQNYPCQKYDNSIYAESFIKWIRQKLAQ